MPRRVRLLLAVSLFTVLVPSLAHAQFGGIKKKISGIKGQNQPQTTAQTGGNDPGLTPDVVDRYVKALAAGAAERARIAHSNTPVGRYLTGREQQRALRVRCDSLSDWRANQYSRLIREKKYDSASATVQRRYPECEQVQAEPQDPGFTELRQAQSRQDSVAAEAGSFTMYQWGLLSEAIPPIVRGLVDEPQADPRSVAENFRRKPEEIAAVKARQDELARSLAITASQRKTKPAPGSEAAAPAQAQPDQAPNEKNGQCANTESAKHKEEVQGFVTRLQAAQQKGDMNLMKALSDSVVLIQNAMMKKCGMGAPGR